ARTGGIGPGLGPRVTEASAQSLVAYSLARPATYNECRFGTRAKAILAMPPNEECPSCRQTVEDWHIEWYAEDGPLLFKGLAALDCPLCGQPVGYQQGWIGSAPPGVPLLRRSVAKAAAWAPLGAKYAGGTLQGYVSTAGPGSQYASYWTPQEVQQADA